MASCWSAAATPFISILVCSSSPLTTTSPLAPAAPPAATKKGASSAPFNMPVTASSPPALYHLGRFQPPSLGLAQPSGSPTPLAGRRFPRRGPSLRGRKSALAPSSRSPLLLRLGPHRRGRQDLLCALRSQRLFRAAPSLGPPLNFGRFAPSCPPAPGPDGNRFSHSLL